MAEKTEPQAITFRGLSGPRMVATTAEEPVWIFVPKRKEDIEAEQREEAARGWWSLHGVAAAGFAWLPADVTLANGEELNKTDATTMLGFGVRTTFSLMSWLLAEGEATYMSTGEARFPDVSLEGGMQGDLVRSARLVRAQFGFMVRLGDGGVVPVVRGGVGVQGAFYSARIDGMGAPGDGFEIDALWHFGPGLVIPVGERCALAANASFAKAVSSDERSLGLGLDFGCAWKPEDDDD